MAMDIVTRNAVDEFMKSHTRSVNTMMAAAGLKIAANATERAS